MKSYEKFIQAAEAIVARGEKPTFAAVRDEAGGGSYTDIAPALRLFRARGVAAAQAPAEPAPTCLSTALDEIWKRACELAQARLAAERAALHAARAEFDQTLDELLGTCDASAMQLDVVTVERDAARSELCDAQAIITRLRADLDATRALLRDELAQLAGRVESETAPRMAGATP